MARVAPPKPESFVEKRRSLAEGEGALEALSPTPLNVPRVEVGAPRENDETKRTSVKARGKQGGLYG